MPKKKVNSRLHFWPPPPPWTPRVHHMGTPLTNENYSLPQGCPEFVEPRQSEERDETLKQLQVLFVRLTETQLSTNAINTLTPTILTVWYPGNNTLNILTGESYKEGRRVGKFDIVNSPFSFVLVKILGFRIRQSWNFLIQAKIILHRK